MDKEIAAKLLDKAAQICVNKHAGQRDKMGCAYFQHPMRVAMRCKTDDEKIVALLHDVIEDTDVTADYLLAEGFPEYIVDAVLSVTKQDGEIYGDFVARAKQNPIGRWVKVHDLEDNLDVLRLDDVSPAMAKRFTKYLAARRYLLQELDILPESVSPIFDDIPSYISELQKVADQRAFINENIKSSIDLKIANYNEYTIHVKMADGSYICHENAIDTLKDIIGKIGYDKVAALDIMIDGKYPLLSKTKNKYNTETPLGWYVLSNISNLKKAYYLNLVFDKLNLPLIADFVTKK